jgi:hypothetical protein
VTRRKPIPVEEDELPATLTGEPVAAAGDAEKRGQWLLAIEAARAESRRLATRDKIVGGLFAVYLAFGSAMVFSGDFNADTFSAGFLGALLGYFAAGGPEKM